MGPSAPRGSSGAAGALAGRLSGGASLAGRRLCGQRFRWRDAGPRTREEPAQRPCPPPARAVPPPRRAYRPGAGGREAPARGGGWSPAACRARARLPRGVRAVGRPALEAAGRERVHFGGRGATGLGALGGPAGAPRALSRPAPGGCAARCRGARCSAQGGCRVGGGCFSTYWGRPDTPGMGPTPQDWARAPRRRRQDACPAKRAHPGAP